MTLFTIVKKFLYTMVLVAVAAAVTEDVHEAKKEVVAVDAEAVVVWEKLFVVVDYVVSVGG